jgi:GNAT superfamily N-acetyltransferase
MNGVYIVTEAIERDIPGILSVRKITWIFTYPNAEYGITKADIEKNISQRDVGAIETWSKRLKDDNVLSHTWVAKENDIVVGFVSAHKGSDINVLMALYVLPNYQKRGIGAELMKAALSWLGNDRNVSLDVVRYNIQAIQFYKKLGFIENGPTVNEVGVLTNGKQLPEIKMIKLNK